MADKETAWKPEQLALCERCGTLSRYWICPTCDATDKSIMLPDYLQRIRRADAN